MSQLVIERPVSADPTSLALLVAGPSGADLWPGTERGDFEHGRLRVDLPEQQLRLVVHAEQPRRSPTSFTLAFGWEELDDPRDGGEALLSLAYDSTGPGSATRAKLTVELRGRDRERRADAFLLMAGGFLDNLAAVAEARARAA